LRMRQMFVDSKQTLLLRAFPLILLLVLAACGTAQKPAPTHSQGKASPNTNSSTASTVTISPPPVAPAPADSTPLFDGKTLKGWEITDFAAHGEVKVIDQKLILSMGVMTGVTYTNPFPKMNYEIELDAMRVDGDDFFCG